MYLYRPIRVYKHGDIADAFSYRILTVSADAVYFDVILAQIFKEMITAGISFC